MYWKPLLSGTALLLGALGAAAYFFWPFTHGDDELRLPGVVEIQEVRLGSKVGGRISEVNVKEGDVVSTGQVLVRFEIPELEAQRDQWQARLRSLEAEYEKAKNGPRPEEIRQAENDLASAEADFKQAREDYTRIDRLFRQGGSDKAEYDMTRAARDRSQGKVGSARAHLDMLKAGSRSEDIADAEARVLEMRGKVRELDANIQEATVKAPERAFVEVVAVRKGDLVPPNQPIIRVLRADDLWVKVYVPETQLGKIRNEQKAAVTIDSFPGKRFTGVVFKVDSASEFTPRNIQSIDERRFQVFGVKVHVVDPEGIFKSGMAAEVTFDLAAASANPSSTSPTPSK
jgi:HlyD family secretion protein